MPNTARLALPYPASTDTADVPRDVRAVADKLDPSATIFLQGTAAARPAAGTPGRFYLATDTDAISYDTGTAWLPIAPGSSTVPVVTAVPAGASAVEGQECLLYSSGIGFNYWHLRFRQDFFASDGYGWLFVGGAPLRAAQDAAFTGAVNQTTYAALTSGMSLTPGPKGIYDVTIEGTLSHPTTGITAAFLSYTLGGTAASDAWAASLGGSSVVGTVVKSTRHTISAASQAIVERQRTSNTTTAMSYSNRRLIVHPVRLG